MAAEVPVKDVLCEAMEYLSKLGSNLRTRSENLMDKKIRREKLNNVLAVQKAANKVLLICELSKKSLANVETGVRKVLDHIDRTQSTPHHGAKTSKCENNEGDKKYFYIVYKSRKLRIKKRISLKHYTSVRVRAKCMPQSMIDKYPVHIDCKLYRLRKREIASKSEEDSQSQNENIVRESAIDDVELEKKGEKEIQDNNVSIISIPDTPPKKSCQENVDRKISDNKQEDMSVISIPDTPRSVENKDVSPGKLKKHKEKSSKERKYNNDENQKSPSKSESKAKFDEDSKYRKERQRSNSSSMQEHRRNSESYTNDSKNKRKRIIIEDSSDDDKRSDVEPEDKRRKLSSSNNTITGEDVEDTINPDAEDAKRDSSDNSNDKKPMIKCVSISKLLKPDVLEKAKPNNEVAKDSFTSEAKFKSEEKRRRNDLIAKKMSLFKKDEEAKIKRKAEEQAQKEKEEKSYWIEKRKEVETFKSKDFFINITRLPNLSVRFLKQLSLRKIIKSGVTICEINDDAEIDKQNDNEGKSISESLLVVDGNITQNNKSKTCSKRFSSNDDDKDLIAEANKVKSSLLNESDSDDDAVMGMQLIQNLKSDNHNTDSIKKSLLHESDDSQISAPKEQSDTDTIKDKDDTEEVKSRLLNDSDSASDNKSTLETETNNKATNASDSERENIEEAEMEKDKTVTDASKMNSEKSGSERESDNEEREMDKLVEKSAKILSKSENNKTPEKEGNSDDDTVMRKTPESKKKRDNAKRMLLRLSSDSENEQLKDVSNEVKQSLLHDSDDENAYKKHDEEPKPKHLGTSSSDEDVIKKIKMIKSAAKEKKKKHSRRRHRKRHVSQSSNEKSDNSKSSSSKMVRSKSKPGNASSQNSDAADSSDKDIDGLTNLNSLIKTRRRNSSGSDMNEEAKEHNTRTRGPKAKTGLICEEMLKAESSSDGASDAEIDEIEDTELPEVTLPSFNGAGGHLVKEDLLEESDSSISHNESANKEDSDDEEKVNARRKKQNAISSDSEVGSSRKKDADVRMSDFEDSDDSELNKRSKSKRKKKATDSDASVGSRSSNEGKKKRRRIKSVRDSDVSGSESETEGKNKHGRKNIRKVMGKNQLEEATKKAAREEKERIARIAERQKMYNNLQFDESGKPDEIVLDKVVLDFDPETKEPLIQVDRGLVKKLKPHQANGIKFMWDACFESVKRIKKDKGSGCILAHCMGLGKTLQVVTLTHTLLIHDNLTNVKRVLVVCPLSTVLNWVNEFNMWLKHAEDEYEVDVYELSRYKQNSERAFQLSQWFQHGGVCVLGYEMFRNLSADNVKKFKKKLLKNFQEALVDPGPDLVVCDEGHLLKNEKTSLSQSMNRVKTLRRIVLTGTPLQNNLKEYYCMVQFVKPNLLGKYNEYLNRFVNPITNGQYTDSTEHDIKIMKRRSHVLHKMLDGAVQRRDYGVLAPFLPPKHEYVLFITLSEVQTKLYQHYLDNFSRRPTEGKSSGFLFPDFQSLQRIWTHPLVLKYNSERYEIMQQKKRDKEEEEESEGSLVDFINDGSTPEESSTEESTDDSLSDMSDDNKRKKKSSKKGKGKSGRDAQARGRRGTRANPIELDEEEKNDDVIEVKNENPTEWWIKLVEEAELEDMRNSHKLVLLFDILRQCDAIGDKLLVFSQSLYSLDLIEHFLGKVDDATQEARVDEKLGGHVGSWSPGVDYFRLDGSTSCENRSIWCKNFNRVDNPRARLFLISTRAGGLGINLVAANRVVIFDVSWNPSHDVQSIFRVYRFGQKKPCYVYRFLAMGTMEEKIYERQVTKQAISKRVIDEQQIDRHYAENDLAELYKFEPKPPVPRPIPPLPKDRLFAEMLREHEEQIYKYHEHDSLLENKEEETLSEEERKAAWEDFENEKTRPPPVPFTSPWPTHNGMNAFIAQQQYAMAALSAMVRKEAPNLNENQIRDYLRQMNPQVLQQMSEMLKYPQGMMNNMMNPSMMNPGLMNQVMNAAGGGGMSGMSGASGLQYEPPWQRQQQQQQNMRLQQILQQQNQMGTKFYAGGLGSRDPTAMMLQQQRAREIMLGNQQGGAAAGAGRPRGRPPLQPRAPPPTQGDVVDLDSD